MNIPSKAELQGMTVNERLAACNLFDAWDKAVSCRDQNEMIKILLKTAMTDEQAKETTKTIMSSPEQYGF